jgi:hypothetical protein
MVIFCVAESLRNDHIATAIAQSMRARFAGLIGVEQRLDMLALLPIARAWGQTSDAILDSLSPQTRELTLRSGSSPEEYRQGFGEKVLPSTFDEPINQYVKGVKVLKLPN